MEKSVETPVQSNVTVFGTPFRRLALHSAVAAALFGGGYTRGVYAGTCTAGPVSVCSGVANDGLDTTQTPTGTPLTVTTTEGFGIDTRFTGGDALTLTGTDGLNFTDANSASITGKQNGIIARNIGTGALTVTSSGVVTGITKAEGSFYSYAGINATNEFTGTDLILNANTVTGGDQGIYAVNSGSGVLSITSSGEVSDSSGSELARSNQNGIYSANAAGTELTHITTAVGNTNGGENVQHVNNSVVANSVVIIDMTLGNHKATGIRAKNWGGTDLTIATAAVTGGSTGISATNYGSGVLSISSSGAVTGRADTGISASNFVFGTDLILNVADVTGGVYGIAANNSGSGLLHITSSGEVTGRRRGISASNSGTDLIISTSADTSGGAGIYAGNWGSGALEVTSNSVVRGTSEYGIMATNNQRGTDLSVTTNAVAGAASGVVLRNFGSGALTFTGSGDLSGDRGDGISARNHGTDLTLTTAGVSGRTSGIVAENYGHGALSITSSEEVKGSSRYGIYAANQGTDLTVETAAAVTGDQDGIQVRNLGSGMLSIASSGEVTGTHRNGIYAYSRNHESTGLTITTSAVTGREVGIGVRGRTLNGAMSITSRGEVVGTNLFGIYASHYGTDLTITTAAVRGGLTGIRADISRGQNLTIRSDGEVTGSVDGIDARSRGEGALTVTSSAAVMGTTGSGIEAINYRYGTDLTLLMAAVTGGKDGIYALNFASGALSVTSSGTVTGASNSGIALYNDYRSTELTLTTSAVTGGVTGIYARHDGGGALTITTNGTVTGGTGNALWLERTVAGTTGGTITNNGRLVSEQDAAVLMGGGFNFGGNFINNGDITGGNGTAFDISAAGKGMVFDQVAGTITGNVLLGRGDDVVNVTGGTINGQIIGQGFGTINIDVGSGNDFTSHGVVNVEDYVIQSGTVHQMGDFSTAAATTTVNTGATLSFNSLVNGAGALVSNGNLEFIVNPAPGGQLVQAGTVTLNEGSTLFVNYNGVDPVPNQSLLLISATNIIDNGVVVSDSSLLYDVQAFVTSVSVSVQLTVNDLGTISPLKNPSAFGGNMTAFINAGGNNAVVDLLAELPAGDVQGFEQIADVFSPSVSGAVAQGSLEANDSTRRLINERFVGSETGDRGGKPRSGLWLQGYGGEADQDSIDHVEGFDADTGGVAVGYDRDIEQWRVGVAFSSGETDVDNDRFASDSIDIDSNQFIVYGGY